MLIEKYDMAAAKKFFGQAQEGTGCTPERVTTTGHDAYPRAINEVLGDQVVQRTNRYLNNRIEQDHRGVKQRDYPMRGFGSPDAAGRFCSGYDKQRSYFQVRSKSLTEQRRIFRHRVAALQNVFIAA